MPNTQPKTLPDKSLLGELYKSRWEQVRHVNDVDQRSIVMVGSALAGLFIVYPDVMGLSTNLASALSLLAAVICYGSINSVIHNRLSLEYAMAAIDQLETRFNKMYPGLFPTAGSYVAPRNYREFRKRMLRSIRGPIIITFAVALGETIFLGLSLVLGALFPYPYSLFVPLASGIVVTPFVPNWTMRQEYRAASDIFANMNSLIEKGIK